MLRRSRYIWILTISLLLKTCVPTNLRVHVAEVLGLYLDIGVDNIQSPLCIRREHFSVTLRIVHAFILNPCLPTLRAHGPWFIDTGGIWAHVQICVKQRMPLVCVISWLVGISIIHGKFQLNILILINCLVICCRNWSLLLRRQILLPRNHCWCLPPENFPTRLWRGRGRRQSTDTTCDLRYVNLHHVPSHSCNLLDLVQSIVTRSRYKSYNWPGLPSLEMPWDASWQGSQYGGGAPCRSPRDRPWPRLLRRRSAFATKKASYSWMGRRGRPGSDNDSPP